MRVLRHSWNVKEVFRYLAVGFCTPHGLSFKQLWREQDLILYCSTFYIILFLNWFKVGLKFLCLVLPLFASSGNLTQHASIIFTLSLDLYVSKGFFLDTLALDFVDETSWVKSNVVLVIFVYRSFVKVFWGFHIVIFFLDQNPPQIISS